MTYTLQTNKFSYAVQKTFHAYPAFVIGICNKIFGKKMSDKIESVKVEIMDIQDDIPLFGNKQTLLLEDSKNETKEKENHETKFVTHDYVHNLIVNATPNHIGTFKTLWNQIKEEFPELISEHKIEVQKTQIYKRASKNYIRVCKNDYINALKKVNALLNVNIHK